MVSFVDEFLSITSSSVRFTVKDYFSPLLKIYHFIGRVIGSTAELEKSNIVLQEQLKLIKIQQNLLKIQQSKLIELSELVVEVKELIINEQKKPKFNIDKDEELSQATYIKPFITAWQEILETNNAYLLGCRSASFADKVRGGRSAKVTARKIFKASRVTKYPAETFIPLSTEYRGGVINWLSGKENYKPELPDSKQDKPRTVNVKKQKFKTKVGDFPK